MSREKKPASLGTLEVALRASQVLDIPPRTRGVLIVAALAGVELIAIGSLVSGRPQQIQTDKIIHFSGYFALSFLFVLALRPLLFVPGLLALVATGVALEFLQRHTGRTFAWRDGLANTIGVGVGGGVGLVVRGVYAWLRGELIAASLRRRRRSLAADELVFSQGDPAPEFYIVQSGLVELARGSEGGTAMRTLAGPGEVLGIMGVVLGQPHFATARTVRASTLVPMTAAELFPKPEGKLDPSSLVIRELAKRVQELAERLEGSGHEVHP